VTAHFGHLGITFPVAKVPGAVYQTFTWLLMVEENFGKVFHNDNKNCKFHQLSESVNGFALAFLFH